MVCHRKVYAVFLESSNGVNVPHRVQATDLGAL
jgi:hypothetical protein